MQGMGGHGQIASGQFMRTLGAGFYPLQSLRDGEIDGLIIAQLKMQAGEILGAAPIDKRCFPRKRYRRDYLCVRQ